jgi:hypothetical protein
MQLHGVHAALWLTNSGLSYRVAAGHAHCAQSSDTGVGCNLCVTYIWYSSAGSQSVRRLLATVTVATFRRAATRPHLRVKSKLIILATCWTDRASEVVPPCYSLNIWNSLLSQYNNSKRMEASLPEWQFKILRLCVRIYETFYAPVPIQNVY